MCPIMVNRNAYVLPALLMLISLAGQGAGAVEPNASEGVAIHGYDPVSYFQEGPKEGRPGLSARHNGVEYHFASQANKETFTANPGQYIPEYGGWCAYAMLEGDKVDVDPQRYKIIDGSLYLFYDGFWGNTLKKWNEKAQNQSDEALVAKADAQWQGLSD